MTDKTKVLKSIQTGLSVTNGVLNIYGQGREWYINKYMYRATLAQDAYVYPEIMQLIDAQNNAKSFRLSSTKTGVSRFYNSEDAAILVIDGHKLKVQLYKRNLPTPDEGMIVSSSSLKQTLEFTSKSMDAIYALENLLEKITDDKKIKEKIAFLYTPSTYSDWMSSRLPKKSMDSIFLAEGEKESLIADVDKFLKSEERFLSAGLPWHRGYCFYGDPGNGKSSIALALANHFALDLHNLNLSAIKTDADLSACISDVRDGSILLLEDVDVYSKTMGREQEKDSPTLAGLLNSLDGVSTPHGLITIMTTNRYESLDPALVRKGRMDYKLELKAPVAFQIEAMFKQIFNEPLDVETKNFVSMADVADVFKRNLDDSEAARVELKS